MQSTAGHSGCLLPLLLAAVAPAILAQAPADGAGAGSTTVQLHAKAHRHWQILLPDERFVDVGAGFVVPHAGGERFAVASEGEVLRADLDGDGAFEAVVEGKDAFLTLSGKSKGGNALSYSVRLVRQPGRPWQYSCGSAMAGSIAGTPVEFIDQNLNGTYGDYGEDAMVVGNDEAASFLSHVVSVDGKLYTIDVAADGSTCTYAPYTGPVGELDLNSAFTCSGKLRAAIVRSADGKFSFDLATAKPGMQVPAGTYTLQGGQVVLGDGHATLATGRARQFEVTASEKRVVTWGGPVHAEFAFHREGGKVGFAPSEIWYYGKLGERFADFMPLGKSPEFTIKDKKTGEVLAVARFPGNC
jgi:hypothetical protein